MVQIFLDLYRSIFRWTQGQLHQILEKILYLVEGLIKGVLVWLEASQSTEVVSKAVMLLMLQVKCIKFNMYLRLRLVCLLEIVGSIN